MAETPVTPIAVIGMACRLPNGIDSPAKLWDALLRGDDLVTEVPLDRWDAEEFFDPEAGVAGRSVSKWGGFLDDVGGFDADFFGIGEREAIALDPQQRLLLETSWEALEHGGIDPGTLAGSLTGVFVGMTGADYQLVAADAQALDGPYGFTGSNFSMASGRIAYALGATGPAYTVDSACSSGLLAVHNACRSLHDGESDLALAGGVHLVLEPRKMASGSAQGMLSPTGRCHSFDVEADGFVSGEAVGMVLLKRLPDAVRDGDRVLAVIRGTAANQDGRTVNIATPSRDAQVAVYQAALAAAGTDPATIGMVEAHGTGTPVGDPIEYAGLAHVYGTDGPCALGSAKTNFGHTQSASGTVSLIKAVLALQEGVVPQSLHFNRLPDQMAEIDTNLFVAEANVPWPATAGHPRRAAVSSYGLSGTNVHAVVEQAPPQSHAVTVVEGGAVKLAPTDGPKLFTISSSSVEALKLTAGRLADWVADPANAAELTDLGYTLARRRGHRDVRASVLAGSREELVKALHEVSDGEVPYQPAVAAGGRGPVWVFSGHGSQWAGMGASLLAAEPVFAETVAGLEPLIARESGFSVTEAMSASEVVTGMDRVQPTVFAMQVALAATMKAYGVNPGAVIGHSMGEAAAAVVAGALSVEDGVKLICRRSRLMAGIAGSGAMASVELPAAQVLSELAAQGVGDVVLSVVASPQSTVVGGATESIRNLVAGWEKRGLLAREVAVEVASHSPQVDPILDDLADELADLTPMEPTVPYYSATLYDPREEPMWDADYWADNLRYTVRFAAAVQAALEDGYRVFGELSPHPLLTVAVEQTARSLDMSTAVLASMRREQEMPSGLLGFVGDLHDSGAVVDFSALYPDGRLVEAPLAAWTHRTLMLTREGHDRQGRGGSSLAVHPLLGAHVLLPEDQERHVWQSDVGIVGQPWLDDHRVHDVAALPGAAYCEMALTAAAGVLGDGAAVTDLAFHDLLLLDDKTVVSTVAAVLTEGVAEFGIETSRDGERARRASARLETGDGSVPPNRDIAALLDTHGDRTDGAELRETFAAHGIQYGPAFAGLVSTGTGPAGSVFAEVALPPALRSQQSAYSVHPALLDACFQSVAVHPTIRDDASGLLLPLGVRRIRVHAGTRQARYCIAQVTKVGEALVEANLEILDEHGAVLVTVDGLRLGSHAGASQRDHTLNNRLLTVDWIQPSEPKAGDFGNRSVLVIDTTEPANPRSGGLVAALASRGVTASTMVWPTGADDTAAQAALEAQLDSENVGAVVVFAGGERTGESGSTAVSQGAAEVRRLVHIARLLPEASGAPRLYLLTQNAQSVVEGDAVNLGQAGLRGLIRVIGVEHPHLHPTMIDLDGHTDSEQLAAQVLSASEEDETAWRDGIFYVARLNLSPLGSDDFRSTVVDHQRDGVRLQIRTPGDLQSLELAAVDRVEPGPGQIEVAVRASNLNFADVLVALGRYPSFEGRMPQLGADYAGEVVAVGPGVTEHEVGDLVAGISTNGAWATYITCDANLAVALPPSLTAGQAAAVPSAHATAWYSLHNLARISSRDKVLIHSATGGVGQAAIAIARAAGAEIFATAGSPHRRELLRGMGITHVYDSRSTDFADQIRRDTDGYGVDIVLNSLPGAAQRAGLELLSFGGRFVEIGKRDIYGDTRLGLFPFRRNLAFYAVDLALLTLTDPNTVRELLTTIYQHIADGVLPAPETTHYPLTEGATAIRVMGAAEHTGKLVLDVPRSGQDPAVVPPSEVKTFRPDGSYIVTGGLSGLGLFLAEKMAESGCGRVILNGRSAPGPAAQSVLRRIRSLGVEVEVERGDIADPATARRLVEAATASGLPLRGILHAAAVVEDATLSSITDELIERDWAPKVRGAWNLHESTTGHSLDWFCSFSSAAALVGSPGQGAYASANSWLDAFAHWRKSQGLPATAIAWGAWSEIGQGQNLAQDEAMAIQPDDGAYAFDSLLRHDRTHTGYAPVAGAPWLASFAQSRPFAEAFRNLDKGRAGGSQFLAELRSMPTEEWAARLRRLISDAISLILRRSVDPDRPLSEYGLDSLGNLELRTRIETETGIRISPMGITTIRALAESLTETLAAEATASTPS